MTSTHFIAHDNELIWGIGATAEEATADALNMSSELIGLITHQCTPELAAEVELRGGAISFGMLPDGTMGTGDQIDAA